MSVTVLVDTGNLYYCIHKKFPGKKLDYNKYREKAVGDKSLMAAVAYGTTVNEGTQSFANMLQAQGWIIEFKRPQFTGKVVRYNWAAGLSCMAFKMLKDTDRFILGVTSIEYIPLVDFLQRRNKEVCILSCGINRELKEACKEAVEIKEDLLCD